MRQQQRYDYIPPATVSREVYRAPSVRQDVAPAALRAALIGAAGGAGSGLIVGLMYWDTGATLAAAGITFSLLFAVLLWRTPAASRLMERVEEIVERDLDGDGVVGVPGRARIQLVPCYDQAGRPAYTADDAIGFLETGFDAGGFSRDDMSGRYNTRNGRQIDPAYWKLMYDNVLGLLVDSNLFWEDERGEAHPYDGVDIDAALAALGMRQAPPPLP